MQPITLEKKFFDYMYLLEQTMISKPDIWKNAEVSRKACSLSKKQFGQLIGNSIDTELNVVIDYFGLLKKSKGFLLKAKLNRSSNVINTRILYFQSIKIENLPPELISYFPQFKQTIISIRKFPTK